MPSALVTGASRGIGHATAVALARRGFHVLAGVRTEEAAQNLTGEASASVTPILLDVTDDASVRAAADSVGERLDVLVNNAGIPVGGVLEALPLEAFRQTLEVNVVGQVALTQAVLPALRATSGRVIFMSSISGRVSAPALTPYAASKFALEAIADGLRIELRAWDIDVVLIEPSAIDTDMWRGAEDQYESQVAAMSEEHRELYAPLLAAVRKVVAAQARRAADVGTVTKVIEEAATATRPRTRYLVGADARTQAFMRSILPDRAFDALVARMFTSRS
jgi:NAD(P)-dependent dehydrogenase (short-subunit alcohol dehydrogenase family)